MNWAGAVTLPANQDRLDESKRIQYVLSYKKDVVNPLPHRLLLCRGLKRKIDFTLGYNVKGLTSGHDTNKAQNLLTSKTVYQADGERVAYSLSLNGIDVTGYNEYIYRTDNVTTLIDESKQIDRLLQYRASGSLDPATYEDVDVTKLDLRAKVVYWKTTRTGAALFRR